MSNCVFGFPDFTQRTPLRTPSASNAIGSFVASLPASNALDRRLDRVARTTDASTTSTRLPIDLGADLEIGLMAVLIPNLTKTTTPTVRFVAGTSAGDASTYDSGNLQAIPTGVSIEDLIGPDGSLMNLWQVVTPPPLTSRYPSVLVDDHLNADGWVDFARVIIAGAFRPIAVDISDGMKSQPKSATVRTETDGGAALFNVKPSARCDGFSIDDFADADAATVRAMKHRLGTSGQFFWMPDATDTSYGWQRNFLATMEELGALTANQGKTDGEFAVLEVL